MRQINMTEKEKMKLASEFIKSLSKPVLENIKFEKKINEQAKDKLKIYYSPEAYSKTVRLVKAHAKEVGWNMVIKPYLDGYKVYDILVYPQKGSAAYLSVDLAKYGMWKAQIPEEADANLFGQAHSHVNMSVTPSFVDEKQQIEEVTNKQNGFYFFQIWNKRLEVNSFFYDIDNNLLYDKNDIEMIVEEDDFIKDSFAKVTFEKENHAIYFGMESYYDENEEMKTFEPVEIL